jgi:hypothetical protein
VFYASFHLPFLFSSPTEEKMASTIESHCGRMVTDVLKQDSAVTTIVLQYIMNLAKLEFILLRLQSEGITIIVTGESERTWTFHNQKALAEFSWSTQSIGDLCLVAHLTRSPSWQKPVYDQKSKQYRRQIQIQVSSTSFSADLCGHIRDNHKVDGTLFQYPIHNAYSRRKQCEPKPSDPTFILPSSQLTLNPKQNTQKIQLEIHFMPKLLSDLKPQTVVAPPTTWTDYSPLESEL